MGGELKVTQRNRQKNRETGRKVRVRGRGGRECVCVRACVHTNNLFVTISILHHMTQEVKNHMTKFNIKTV